MGKITECRQSQRYKAHTAGTPRKGADKKCLKITAISGKAVQAMPIITSHSKAIIAETMAEMMEVA